MELSYDVLNVDIQITYDLRQLNMQLYDILHLRMQLAHERTTA